MESAKDFILDHARDGILLWADQLRAMDAYGFSCRKIDRVIFECGLFPERYARHMGVLFPSDHLKLLDARIAIAGCGALGGHQAQYLCRLGIGYLFLIDPDTFAPSNLNRQPFCDLDTLHRSKVIVTHDRLLRMNPGVTVTPVQARITQDNVKTLFGKADMVADGLDNRPDRLMVESACEEMNIPFIHGAVARLAGQVAMIDPGDRFLASVWGKSLKPTSSYIPNVSVMPGIIAGFQTVLAVARICGLETADKVKAWFVDGAAVTVEPLDQ